MVHYFERKTKKNENIFLQTTPAGSDFYVFYKSLCVCVHKHIHNIQELEEAPGHPRVPQKLLCSYIQATTEALVAGFTLQSPLTKISRALLTIKAA